MKVDYAREIDWLLTQSPYKNAPKIRLIQDNLNTHVIASLYKAFPAAKARRLAKRLEIHYTPKHGSWLNIAEISISILTKQCIDRRIPNLEMLNQEIFAWESGCNAACIPVNWHFTSTDARIKLRRLYPVV